MAVSIHKSARYAVVGVFFFAGLSAIADETPAPPTFARDVLPILQEHCQDCHRPGQVGPMSLLSYAEARPWAKGIRTAIANRTMPPFFANAPLGTFAGDPRLTEDEIATILRWVDAGAPQGNPADAPAPRDWPQTEWTRGEPDLVVEFPEFTTVPDNTDRRTLQYSDHVFGPQTWVDSFELNASDNRAVHHVGVFSVNKDRAVPTGGVEELKDDDNNDFVFGERNLFTWLPGQRSESRPEGSAFIIRKNERLVLQTHTAPTTESIPVRLRVGLWLYTGVLSRTNESLSSFMFDIDIPPHESDYNHRETLGLANDVLVTGFNIHMHLRGKASQILFHYPDGRTELAFDMPRFNFDWQRRYWLAEPKPVPANTQIEFIADWDNSAENPLNPDPATNVTWGRRTIDEMYTGDVYFSRQRAKAVEVRNGRVVGPGDTP